MNLLNSPNTGLPPAPSQKTSYHNASRPSAPSKPPNDSKWAKFKRVCWTATCYVIASFIWSWRKIVGFWQKAKPTIVATGSVIGRVVKNTFKKVWTKFRKKPATATPGTSSSTTPPPAGLRFGQIIWVICIITLLIWTILHFMPESKPPVKTPVDGTESTFPWLAVIGWSLFGAVIVAALSWLSWKFPAFRGFIKTPVTIALSILFIAGAIMASVATWKHFFPKKPKVVIASTQAVPTGMPATKQMILHEIAGCESGWHQFEPDGVTPLKNKPLPGKQPSSAFGKYAFLELWRVPATNLGYDLNTEAGQDAMASWVYDHYGTQPWITGVDCWGPKLPGMTWEVEVLALASDEDWSDPLIIPPGFSFDSRSTKGETFSLMDQEGRIINYDPKSKGCFAPDSRDKTQCFTNPVTAVRYRSNTENSVGVIVKYMPYRPII